MQTMNISLPDPLKDFIDEKRKVEERLEALLLEGLESDESVLTKQDFEDIRSEALAQLKRRKKKG
jgi:antitoxin ParD1/3/4